MSKYRAICYYSGYSEGYGETEEEALDNAEYNIPLDANADSFETFCEDSDEADEQGGLKMADETHRLIYADTAHYMLLEGYDIRDVPTAADVQPLSVVAEHIKNRLYETAFNEPDTVARNAIADMAGRVDFWVNELKDGETE